MNLKLPLTLLLLLSVFTSSLMVNSQLFPQTVPLTAYFIYTSSSGVSNNNNLFYLCIVLNGELNISGLSLTSSELSISSISTYISGIDIPSLQLNGLVVSTPKVINNSVFFTYIPGVKSVSKINITSDYLAYANYTQNGWGKVVNLITKGITEDFSILNNLVYAIWKPSPTTSTSYLLVLNKDGIIEENVSLPILNASIIYTISPYMGIIGNTSTNIFSSLSNISLSTVQSVQGEYYIANLTNGRIIKEVPFFEGKEPTYISVSKDGLAVFSYVFSGQSDLVLYNVTSQKAISSKMFQGDAIGYISNDNFIMVSDLQQTSQLSLTSLILVYDMNWSLIYSKESSSLSSYLLGEGLFVTNNSLTGIIATISTQFSIEGITISTTLELQNVLHSPLPFSISYTEEKNNGYTLVYITWNEKEPSRYTVIINGSVVKTTYQESYLYNATTNTTLYVKVIAVNQLGNLSSNITIDVIVYHYMMSSSITSTSTTSSTSITKSSTSTTTSTTSSSTTTTTTTINASTTTTISSTTQSFLTSKNTLINSKNASLNSGINLTYIAFIIVGAIVIFILVMKRKI